MIVCSLPRCGSTKFCLDLEAKTNIPFIGELSPMYLYDNRKANVHETSYQPSFTPSRFADIIHNKDDFIILVNKAAYLSIAESSIVVLRRNMLDAFLSFGNFLLIMYPDINTRVLINEVKFSIYDYFGIKSYIERYPKHVVWYEDYFQKTGTTTEMLDNHRHGRIIKRAIEDAYSSCR